MPGRESPQRHHRPTDRPSATELKILEQLDQILKAEGIVLRRTDNIEKQCKAILVTVVKLQEEIENLNKYVTPDLEAAVKLVERIAVTIDNKVPDNQ